MNLFGMQAMGRYKNNRVDFGIVEGVLIVCGEFKSLLGGKIAHAIDIEIDNPADLDLVAFIVDRINVHPAPPTQADYGGIQHFLP